MERPAKEEFVNGLTHAIGALLSFIGAVWLLWQLNWSVDNAWVILFGLVYVASLIAVYTSSMMSHWEHEPYRKVFYRRLDQAFIYLLIVASYAPFSARFLHETYFVILLGLMWFIAVVGFVSKLWAGHRVQSVAIWIYLALGWMTTFAFVPWLLGFDIQSEMPLGCIGMILLGGVFYSGGTAFLYQDKKVWYFHAIWHLFVMLGSAAHYWAILKYVV